jgi:DNA-binding LacI/PurR family transcriptional regulator
MLCVLLEIMRRTLHASSDEVGVRLSRPVTIYDVAAYAGVSISTVSQTINRPNRVNPTTRERVLKAIEDLEYMPKAEAVSHARRGVGRIGVLGPFTSYDSFRRRLAGVLREADGISREVVVYDHESASVSLSPLLRTLPITGRIDGLLVMGLPLDDLLAQHLLTRGLATALVDSRRPEFSSVTTDDESGGAMAARHLIERGHQRFAFLSEQQRSDGYVSSSQRRNVGFTQALAQAGLPTDVPTVLSDNDLGASRRALPELLALNPVPTAVFASHDLLAAGLLAECRRTGVRVPDDLAVVGFDDGPVAEAAGLTTIRQPFEESGRVGARLLGDLLGGSATGVRHIELALELVVREST